MKLGKKKIIILNILFIILFMIFISTFTVSYLYKTNNITKDEYFSLLLSDTYGDDFYIKLVEIINKNFNPLKVIEIPSVSANTFNLSNEINITQPIVYIYNEEKEDYKEEYNVKPNVLFSAYFLCNTLNEIGIQTIFEESNISEFSKNNNLNENESINLFISEKLNNYPSIKYVFNIGRVIDDKKNTTININNKDYALISLYTSNNMSLITKLNSILNEKYNGISKIYYNNSYNNAVNIDFGGNENSMKEVYNSIEAFSQIFKEVIS